MKLYAPSYYKNFSCIASACRHSCCIGWEIDIDEGTLAKYERLEDTPRAEILESIDRKGEPHFRLTANERCPHLDERGLCRIISALGEGYLCEICREHPRFYHDTARGREVGLGMACEEAARIILLSTDYALFEAVGRVEGDAGAFDFDALSHRAKIYELLADSSLPYAERLQRIEEAYGVSPKKCTDEEWREILADLEYLDDAHRDLFAQYTGKPFVAKENEIFLERALAYFVFRHMSDAEDEEEMCASLGFALFAERLLASITATEKGVAAVVEAARILSEELEYSEENTERLKLVFWD